MNNGTMLIQPFYVLVFSSTFPGKRAFTFLKCFVKLLLGNCQVTQIDNIVHTHQFSTLNQTLCVHVSKLFEFLKILFL